MTFYQSLLVSALVYGCLIVASSAAKLPNGVKPDPIPVAATTSTSIRNFVAVLNGDQLLSESGARDNSVRAGEWARSSQATAFPANTVGFFVSNPGYCETKVIAGLSRQIVQWLRCKLGVSIEEVRASAADKVALGDSAVQVPFLQTAVANAFRCFAKAHGSTVTANSLLRTVPQQLFLFKKAELRLCGITRAGRPDASNHLSGTAFDTNQYAPLNNRPTTLRQCKLRWFGPGDVVHFDYTGSDIKDLRRLSVTAFQQLHNACAPKSETRLAVDGSYGPATERAIMRAPATGFANCNICPDSAAPAAPKAPVTTAPTGSSSSGARRS